MIAYPILYNNNSDIIQCIVASSGRCIVVCTAVVARGPLIRWAVVQLTVVRAGAPRSIAAAEEVDQPCAQCVQTECVLWIRINDTCTYRIECTVGRPGQTSALARRRPCKVELLFFFRFPRKLSFAIHHAKNDVIGFWNRHILIVIFRYFSIAKLIYYYKVFTRYFFSDFNLDEWCI